jgi:hypothetical protein
LRFLVTIVSAVLAVKNKTKQRNKGLRKF